MRAWPENQIMLAMIRHGATKANEERRYLGKTDEMLSEEGKQMLARYKKGNCYPPADVLFVSPMMRCRQTADILYPHLKPVLIPEWTEMDFGAFENKNYEELKNDTRYQKWIDSGGTAAFPDGENRGNFILRCKKGADRMWTELRRMGIAGKARESNSRVGTIVHGGTVMALLSEYYGGSYFDYQVPNGMGYICVWKECGRISEVSALGEQKV